MPATPRAVPLMSLLLLGALLGFAVVPPRAAAAIRWWVNESVNMEQAREAAVPGALVAQCGACEWRVQERADAAFNSTVAGGTGVLVRSPREPTDCAATAPDGVQRLCTHLDLGICGVNGVPFFAHIAEDAFRGMTALTHLDLGVHGTVALPPSLFQGLTSLQSLQFHLFKLTALDEAIFADVAPTLTYLGMQESALMALPVRIFEGMARLTYLSLRATGLASIPPGLFAGLSAMRELDLMSNAFASLPVGVFDDLVELRDLRAPNNNLGALPRGRPLFTNLAELTWLGLKVNRMADLEPDTFKGLSKLRILDLSDNPPLGETRTPTADAGNASMAYKANHSLPKSLFEPVPALRALYMARSELQSLPEGIWSPLTDLRVLNLQGNADGFCYPPPLPASFPATASEVDHRIFDEEKFPYPHRSDKRSALSAQYVGALPCTLVAGVPASSPASASSSPGTGVGSPSALSADVSIAAPVPAPAPRGGGVPGGTESADDETWACTCTCASPDWPAPIIVKVDVHKDDDHNWCWCGATCMRHCGAADGEVVDLACVYTGPSSRSGGGEHHHP